MTGPGAFFVRFWGVRGSIACGGTDFAAYGGNTSCLEVRAGDQHLIFDAGTGLRPLGLALAGESQAPLHVSIYLTHTHFDHICGLPFFQPLYEERNKVDVWSGHLAPPLTTRDAVESLMAAPIFPVAPEIFKADTRFCDFRAGDTLDAGGGVTLKTAPLNHPNGATGYRVNYRGRSISYITDLEHTGPEPDPALVELVRGTDILIYDASYTDAEFTSKMGYGHSTWQAGLALARTARVGRYVLFHHDPAHDDRAMAEIEREAAAAARSAGLSALAAREGMILKPGL